jgi:RNA polymerase sigma-70 factor, ECF subfamily
MDPQRLEDLAAVRRFLDGDREAMNELVQRYYRPLAGVLLRLLGDVHDAADVAQDVFVRIHKTVGGFDPEKGSFFTWLCLQAHSCRDGHLSKRRRRHEVPLGVGGAAEAPDEKGSPDARLLLREEWEKVVAAIDQLPPKHCDVLRARLLEGLSVKETAERLGIPEGTVGSRESIAKARLRDLLKGNDL